MTTSQLRIALLAIRPAVFGDTDHFFGMAIRRIQASLLSDPRFATAEIRVFERNSSPLRLWVDELTDFRPNVLAASAYVWSMPTFALLATEMRRRFPDCLTVLGGPSARPEVLALPPYQPHQRAVDVLVLGEGEGVVGDIIEVGLRDRSALAKIPGIAVSSPLGWRRTPPPADRLDLNRLPSPYQMGLFPKHSTAWLETYRGCPMSCNFCQWGFVDPSPDHLSVDYLVREFEAMGKLDPPMVSMLDVGLNLNSRAFRNLAEAQAQTGFLNGRVFNAETFPTLVREEHLEFLAQTRAEVGIGLQSADPAVLEGVQRPFKRDQFAKVVEDLASVALVWAEIIVGLPGDSPEGVRNTIDFLRELPCNVRMYHCLVLPDGLMTRHPNADQLKFHPITLELESSPGWEPARLREISEWLGDAAESVNTGRQRHLTGHGDRLEDYVENLANGPGWELVKDHPTPSRILQKMAEKERPLEVNTATFGAVKEAVRKATKGYCMVLAAVREEEHLALRVDVEGVTYELSVQPVRADRPAFRSTHGFGFTYRAETGGTLGSRAHVLLERSIDAAGPHVGRLMGAGA